LVYIARDGYLDELLLSRAFLAFLFLPVFFGILFHSLKINFSVLIMAFIRPAIATIIMGFCIYYLDILICTSPDIVKLLIESIAGVIIYSISIITLWIATGMNIGGEDFILDKIARVLVKFNATNKPGIFIQNILKKHKGGTLQ
jgi:hypothetical protein